MPETPAPTSVALDPQTLASIKSIELRARMIVEGLMQGMHRSPYQGFSVEFAQHRQYAPGDDTRFLDWKVYGRTDKLYLKQYQQETNLDLILCIDQSGSMGYGSVTGESKRTWRKFDHAASLAAALAHLALRQQDRVGLVLFDEAIRNRTRLSNARDHWRTVVDMLQMAEAEATLDTTEGVSRNSAGQLGRTSLAQMIDRLAARLTQRSVLVVISDFFDDLDALDRGLAKLSFARHDLMLLHVMDPAELTFPFRSVSDFIGLEGEGRLPLDPSSLKQAYLDVVKKHLDQLEAIARRYRVDYLLLDSSKPLGPPLSHFLASRAAAAGRGQARRT